MTKASAMALATARWGAQAVVRFHRRGATKAQIQEASAALKELRARKPNRPDDDGSKNTSPAFVAYRAAFREWRQEEERLMGIALSHRYDVGYIGTVSGPFRLLYLTGYGDSWAEACERAGLAAPTGIAPCSPAREGGERDGE